ncbi:MAG: hypothetical protein ACK47B_07060 [Armatimonadota bacterium]
MPSIWTVSYVHRDGIDVSTYSSEEAAYQGAAITIANQVENWGTELKGETLAELFLGGQYREMVNRWQEQQRPGPWGEPERLEFEQDDVDAPLAALEQVQEKVRRWLREDEA